MRRSNLNRTVGFMRLVCVLLGIILAVMLGITAYGIQLSENDLKTNEDNQTSAVNAMLTGVFTGKNGKTGTLNILLIGEDKREGEKGNRSDSMILCSYYPVNKQLTMTSFLRDLYVPIPGHGSNRINAAYAYGGAPLLVETLEENFGISIDGTVQVDFANFPQILDELGGVTLELRQDEADEINRKTGGSLQAGLQTMTGEEALEYSRIRNLDPDGDFSRTDRQRKVLNSVWNGYKESSLPTWVKTLGTLLPMIETDMGSGTILAAAVSVFPDLSEINVVSQRIPEAGQCEDRVVDGMAVLVADMDSVRQLLKNRIYGDTET